MKKLLQVSPQGIPPIYFRLREFLANNKWREADQETDRLMLQIAGKEESQYLELEDIKNFPIEDLRIIDQLWVKYSDDKFGFSVQKEIWLDCGGKIGEYDYEVFKKFADRVGWRLKEGKRLIYSDYTFNTTARGHLPLVPPLPVPSPAVGWGVEWSVLPWRAPGE
ncbi:MAG: GUN4 domain-containing protein, partial [Moorea sp. SIO2B7]|nr:GUN4 domain-containing protein [Moorena sp. SIO2B7]